MSNYIFSTFIRCLIHLLGDENKCFRNLVLNKNSLKDVVHTGGLTIVEGSCGKNHTLGHGLINLSSTVCIF